MTGNLTFETLFIVETSMLPQICLVLLLKQTAACHIYLNTGLKFANYYFQQGINKKRAVCFTQILEALYDGSHDGSFSFHPIKNVLFSITCTYPKKHGSFREPTTFNRQPCYHRQL